MSDPEEHESIEHPVSAEETAGVLGFVGGLSLGLVGLATYENHHIVNANALVEVSFLLGPTFAVSALAVGATRYLRNRKQQRQFDHNVNVAVQQLRSDMEQWELSHLLPQLRRSLNEWGSDS